MDNKVIFYIRDEFGYGLEVGTYISFIHSIPLFWNRGKPKTCQRKENQSNQFGFGWVTVRTGFNVMLSCWWW